MAFEENGMLAAGLHDFDIGVFYTDFVEAFPLSQTRSMIFESLIEFLKEILNAGTPDEIWIDGSYATNKVNPNDADLVIFLDYPQYTRLFPEMDNLRQKFYPQLDIYFAYGIGKANQTLLSPADYNTVVNQRNYWKGQFGFDRKDTPKGIIRINKDTLVDYINRR